MWQSRKRSDGELCGPECSPCSVATWDSAHLSGLTCKMREPNGTAPESELLVASDRNLSWLSYHGRYSRDPNGVIRATHCLSLSQLRAFLHLLFGKFFAWGPWVTAGAGVQLSSPGGKRALQSPEHLGKAQRTGLGCAWPSRGHGPPRTHPTCRGLGPRQAWARTHPQPGVGVSPPRPHEGAEGREAPQRETRKVLPEDRDGRQAGRSNTSPRQHPFGPKQPEA